MDNITKEAVHILTQEIRKDPNLYEAYRSNIAVTIQDEFNNVLPGKELHELSNKAAERFLRLWTHQPNDRATLAEQGCQDDLIGQTVHACMKLIHGSGLTPVQQDKVLCYLRNQTIEEWTKMVKVSEKERIERSENEATIGHLINRHHLR